MTDIREQLNKRREDLRRKESRFIEELTYGTHHDSYREASRNIAELRQIEGILATFQLSDAQMRLVKAQEAATMAQLAATEEQRKANEADSRAKADSEEITFWTRRFINTISIASAAAFVSVLTFATKTDSPYVPPEDLRWMLGYFGGAAVMGAIVPIYQLVNIRFKRTREFYTNPTYEDLRASFPMNDLRRKAGKFMHDYHVVTWITPAATTTMFVFGMAYAVGALEGYLKAKPDMPEGPKPSEIRIVYVPVPTTSPVAANPPVQNVAPAN